MLKTGRQYTPGTLNRHVRAPRLDEPIEQPQQVLRHRRESPDFFLPRFSTHATSILACTSIPQQHAYNTSMVLSFRSRRERLHE